MKYDNINKFYYRVSNDSSSIHLDLRVKDKITQNKIILNGLNVEVGLQEKKAKKILVKYPLGRDKYSNINFAARREGMGNAPLMKGRISPEKLKLKVASELNKIEVTELKDKNNPVIYDRIFDKEFFPDIQFDSTGNTTKEVKLSPFNIQSTLYIKLEKSLTQLKEVKITTEKERIVRVTEDISSVKISPLLISKLPNLGEVDIMRSFQLFPGVSATNETSAGLYVRGGTPDQNLILFDGMTIYHVDHFYGFFSAFNANTTDDIELIKGGFPAKYGGRISSVMEISGKPADLEKINGGASVSLLSVNTYLEVPLPKPHFGQ